MRSHYLFFNRLGQNGPLRRAYSQEESICVLSGRGHSGGAIRGGVVGLTNREAAVSAQWREIRA
jgi:hypothetical protein